MTDPIYAVGDIHGQTQMLDRALELIAADGGPDAHIVFMGDYTDRGPDSKGVIDRLIAGQSAGKPWTFLKGNHDRMFEWFMQDTPRHDPHMLVGYHWLHDRIGGIETLASYGVTFPERTRLEDVHQIAKQAVPQTHVDFLRGLSLSHEAGDLLFVHAGIRPGIPLDEQSENDLVWIREPFLDDTTQHPRLIIHGHTALDHPQHFGNRIDLDGGAGYGRPLHPAVFEGTDCWLLKDDGRSPLTP
ncbi:metallophosphoesterase family protein [Phaeobacter marinintestinus]|uniref:metallophosphoesterase family protein n=1 Tax=Falsiphaeobacter marinintestinus TaxID=1492905 RepID=UPI0011B6BF51|nr:metallophosphoesterase family protein [Phaeobacter marinintestinus]